MGCCFCGLHVSICASYIPRSFYVSSRAVTKTLAGDQRTVDGRSLNYGLNGRLTDGQGLLKMVTQRLLTQRMDHVLFMTEAIVGPEQKHLIVITNDAQHVGRVLTRGTKSPDPLRAYY